MNKIAIILILLLAVTFIPVSAETQKVISSDDPRRDEGYVAFVVHSEESDKKEEDKEVVKCTCGGTGVMTHGDGHKTPCLCKAAGECMCGKNVTPTPPAPPKPTKPGLNRKVLLFFTADWCGPCKQFKAQYPKFARKGMTYSDIDDNLETKMEVVDIDKDSTLYDQLKGDRASIPLFILLDKNNNEVASFVGYQDYGTIIRKWNEY